ncbi:hypothetical protein GWI33_017926 [Rhynchophorus ferrugineus]|uniref:Uncharacterized protein n=1 Tax=Rhynchophorus ferrugineus TaxID=354439 RepID=A0A834HXL1_RHYFE|nr:hypothetical protein GWI33_017926 [Rhynchophorus ferrugineus]
MSVRRIELQSFYSTFGNAVDFKPKTNTCSLRAADLEPRTCRPSWPGYRRPQSDGVTQEHLKPKPSQRVGAAVVVPPANFAHSRELDDCLGVRLFYVASTLGTSVSGSATNRRDPALFGRSGRHQVCSWDRSSSDGRVLANWKRFRLVLVNWRWCGVLLCRRGMMSRGVGFEISELFVLPRVGWHFFDVRPITPYQSIVLRLRVVWWRLVWCRGSGRSGNTRMDAADVAGLGSGQRAARVSVFRMHKEQWRRRER